MSEDQAAYYIPQARFVQNAAGVWVMHPESYTGTVAYVDEGIKAQQVHRGALIGPDGAFPERESISLVSGVTAEEMAGREMVLVPKDDVQAIAAALRTAHMHLPESALDCASGASLEWAQARLEAITVEVNHAHRD